MWEPAVYKLPDILGSVCCRFYKSLLHQNGENVGCRLAVVLGLNGLVSVQQRGVVDQQFLHIIVVDAGNGSLAFLVGAAVNKEAGKVAQLAVGNIAAYGGA